MVPSMPIDPRDLNGDTELAGPGSETLDEYARRLGGDVPIVMAEPLAPLAALLDLSAAPVDRGSGRVLWPGEDRR